MRATPSPDGGLVITLSQKNVRELYHMMQLSNAQAVEGEYPSNGDTPMLYKALGTEQQLVVQVETDADHYKDREMPDALAIPADHDLFDFGEGDGSPPGPITDEHWG